MEALGVILIILLCGCIKFASNTYTAGNKAIEETKMELMVNRDFQDELIKKIADAQYREQILDLIKDDLQYIYGDAWKNLFVKNWFVAKPYKTAFDSVENIVLFLLLSKSGLIPYCYKFSDIQIRHYKFANIFECLKILQCVEKNIQKKRGSSDYKLIFNPNIDRGGYSKHRGPEKPRYDQPYLGTFHWAFEKIYYTSPFVMRDIHNPTLVTACKNCSSGERSEKSKNNIYKDKLIL